MKYNHEKVLKLCKDFGLDLNKQYERVLESMRKGHSVGITMQQLLIETVRECSDLSVLVGKLLVVIESIYKTFEDTVVKEKIQEDGYLAKYSSDGLCTKMLVDLAGILETTFDEEKSAEITGNIEALYDGC